MAIKILRRGSVPGCVVRCLRGCMVFALLGLPLVTHAAIVNYQSTFEKGCKYPEICNSKAAHMAVWSANGADLYVPQAGDRSISHYVWVSDDKQEKIFAPATDALVYFEGAKIGGKAITGLNSPWQLILSSDRDQRHLYVISRDTGTDSTDLNTLALFDRNPANGALTFNTAYANNIGGITGIAAPTAMSMSADGRNLNIVSETEQTLSVFRVDAVTGQLAFVQSFKHGTNPDGLAAPSAVHTTLDGSFVYVTDGAANLVAIYARDSITGVLTIKSTVALDGSPNNMIASRDGAFLYISLVDKNSIATLLRDITTGALSLVTTLSNNTNALTALVNPYSLTLSPDDSKLIVGTLGNNSLVVLRRQLITGVLTLIEEHVGPELNGVFGNVFTPQGGNLMTVGAEPGIGLYAITTNDLRVTVTPPATLPAQGQTATYQYEIKEVSGIGATKLALSARIPDGLDIIPATPSQGACAQASQMLSCEFGVINANGSIVLKLALTPQQAAPMRFEVSVFAEQNDIQPGNNTVRVSLPYVAPVAQDDEVIFVVDPNNAGLSQEIDVLANDSGATSGALLTIVSFDAASAHGAVIEKVNEKLIYHSKTNYTGIDTFKYTMQDGAGNKAAPATVTVYVDTPPVAVDDHVSVAVGDSITILVLANDTETEKAGAPPQRFLLMSRLAL